MKQKIIRTMLMVIIFSVITSCSAQNRKDSKKESSDSDYVEVIYFYGKKRCATCNAIEKLSQEVVNEQFSQQLADSTVVFRAIDLSTKEGEEIADYFEVAWSSLFINKVKGKKEDINNMTKFAFATALNNPEEFKKGVADKINSLLVSSTSSDTDSDKFNER